MLLGRKKMKKLLTIAVIGMIAASSVAISHSFTKIGQSVDQLNASQEAIQHGTINEVKLNSEKIYLAVNGEEKLNCDVKTSGNIEVTLRWESEDEGVATVDGNGLVHGVSAGFTRINAYANEIKVTTKVQVTNLIIPVPEEPDMEKELITEKTYTKEENDLLDEILEDRVEKAGYGTRAGVVAAARFLALEFPYRIPYFSENGRLNNYNSTYHVDAEGRYYHKGLYLHSSRYENIGETMYGPGTWGTYIYSMPSEGQRPNGLDCSGFISWVILNGGFDPGDMGAGVATTHPDMTDLGEKKVLKTSIENDEVRAGDLLSGQGSDGGHIALVAGVTEDKYYVAEALWYGTGHFGAIINPYERNELTNNFYWHVDMKDYYKEDGNYTEYWK